ncbi:MAG: tetratricopeptide repeat protein [Acidobacteria bacterium]|nr:tetratricopeptide repeat protein [Acidobacteriota bacterium]MBI3656428.1 tetratricopeptide repeat protein [Acidobacteriota bacterium]
MTPRELRELLQRDTQRRELVDAVVLFADVMDSATISDIFHARDYDQKFLSEFQSVAAETITQNVSMAEDEHFVDCSIRGDEACLIMSAGDLKTDIRVALTVAARIKAAFLARPVNRERLENGRNFFDIGIGIHTGRVTLGLRHNPLPPEFEKPKATIKPEGYTINLAKRVETLSREGSFSHITVSGDAKILTEEADLQMAFHNMGQVVCKGILHRSPVYEVKSPIHLEESWPARIVQTDEELSAFLAAVRVNRTSLWLIMAIAHYYFDKEDYEQARQHYERALRIEPEYAVPKMYLGRTLYRSSNLSSPVNRQLLLGQARDQLEQAIASSTPSVTAHDFLAVVYRRLEKYPEALQHHRIALRISSGSVWAQNALAYTIAEAKMAGIDVNLSEADALVSNLSGSSRFSDHYGYLLNHTKGLVAMAKRGRSHMDEAISAFKIAEAQCGSISSDKKKWEKQGEILYHKSVALHELAILFTPVALSALETAQSEFEKAIYTFGNLTVPDAEPYWAGDAKRRMGEIHLQMNRARRQSTKNAEQADAADSQPARRVENA